VCLSVSAGSSRSGLLEAHRADVLRDQIERRQFARAIRDPCREISSPTALLTEDQRFDAIAWVAWAGRYADQIDPSRQPLSMPEEPEPRPEDLKPFLGGWSPYGP
jgi:hypothetical protein